MRERDHREWRRTCVKHEHEHEGRMQVLGREWERELEVKLVVGD